MRLHKSEKHHVLIGLIISILSFLWIIDNLHYMYMYHFTTVLFLFMFPTWVLVTNVLLGLIGLLTGIALIRQKLKIKRAVLLSLICIGSGGLLKLFFV